MFDEDLGGRIEHPFPVRLGIRSHGIFLPPDCSPVRSFLRTAIADSNPTPTIVLSV
ncbi:hypothetical protein GCM10009776_08640 [Microbacterium deminutum]|uniref:Uncharacterized protein n=1 Tax=Microbacterium deminutum TaxID=344164 RepID=A0ABN2QBE2_9MICO